MQMRMMHQRLPPGVEAGEEPDLRAEMMRIARDGAQGLSGCAKQNAVDLHLVLSGDDRDVIGHGEDDVEILAVEDLGLPAFDPCAACQGLTLGTVSIRAGVIGDALVPTRVALFDMATERGGAARLDRGHHAPLRGRERGGRLASIGLAVAAEDVRHFERAATHAPAP
jgi:hypothetical protein